MRQPKVAKRSAAQVAAGKKFAAGGRAAQAAKRAAYAKSHHGAKLPRTKSQTQASLKWASAGRASQAARKQGKTPPKKAAALAPFRPLDVPRDLPGWSMGCNDWGPTCASAAVANHLLAFTGCQMTENEIALLHMLAGGDEGADIPSVLEALRAAPWLIATGYAPAGFFRADEDLAVPGLIVVTALSHGRHAVLSHPLGMVSWGGVLPWEGEPLEAWAIEWGT